MHKVLGLDFWVLGMEIYALDVDGACACDCIVNS